MFTKDELKNISALINTASIKAEHALTVAVLQQKIAKLMEELENPLKDKEVTEPVTGTNEPKE